MLLLRAAMGAVVLSLLAGCASQIMQSYVGKDIREVEMDYGPPSNIIELGNGKRAYQLVRNSTYVGPSSTTTTTHSSGMSTLRGNIEPDRYRGNISTSGRTHSTSFNSGSVISEESCVYTLIASYQKAQKAWIVESYRQPSFMCD
jgi:hypothetical protein